jgi:hypothetical protein
MNYGKLSIVRAQKKKQEFEMDGRKIVIDRYQAMGILIGYKNK